MASSPVDVIVMDPNSGNPHQCTVCYKVFVSSKGLQQHSIIHTDRKPFSCEICGKPFRFKSNLFEHRSIHTGEQPFVCPFCGKACRLKGNLKKHLKTHVKEADEIDRAYEAVTGEVLGSAASNDDEADYYESNTDVENTPRSHKQRRKTFSPRKIAKSSNNAILMLRQSADDTQNAYPLAPSEYPPLSEMLGSDYGMEDFIRAAHSAPFERYDCRLCELTFVSRGDMRDHCNGVHEMSSATPRRKNDVNAEYIWCDICLCPFNDQVSYDQHYVFHRRIRNMVRNMELELNEMVPIGV